MEEGASSQGMLRVMLVVTGYYLSAVKRTGSAKLAMSETEHAHGFRRSTVYKWLKWRRAHDREAALLGRAGGEDAEGAGPEVEREGGGAAGPR